MNFSVNGKPRQLEGEPTVGDYLRSIKVNPLMVAVEMDGAIVKRDAFDVTCIPEGAKLEVVRMMGGGRR